MLRLDWSAPRAHHRPEIGLPHVQQVDVRVAGHLVQTQMGHDLAGGSTSSRRCSELESRPPHRRPLVLDGDRHVRHRMVKELLVEEFLADLPHMRRNRVDVPRPETDEDVPISEPLRARRPRRCERLAAQLDLETAPSRQLAAAGGGWRVRWRGHLVRAEGAVVRLELQFDRVADVLQVAEVQGLLAHVNRHRVLPTTELGRLLAARTGGLLLVTRVAAPAVSSTVHPGCPPRTAASLATTAAMLAAIACGCSAAGLGGPVR